VSVPFLVSVLGQPVVETVRAMPNRQTRAKVISFFTVEPSFRVIARQRFRFGNKPLCPAVSSHAPGKRQQKSTLQSQLTRGRRPGESSRPPSRVVRGW